jgi:uncharacterized membrane protein
MSNKLAIIIGALSMLISTLSVVASVELNRQFDRQSERMNSAR